MLTYRNVLARRPARNLSAESLDDDLIRFTGLKFFEIPAALVLAVSRHRGKASISGQLDLILVELGGAVWR